MKRKRSYYELRDLAWDNKNKLTFFENELKRRLKGWTVICQYIVPPYIIDFYFPLKCLAVELDGKYHQERERYDSKRDSFLLEIGIFTLRVDNIDFIKRSEYYVELIRQFKDQENWKETKEKVIALRKVRMTEKDKGYLTRRKKKGGVAGVDLPKDEEASYLRVMPN